MSEYIFEGVILPEGAVKGEGVLVKREEIVRCRDCREYIQLEGYATCGYFGGEYAEIEPDGFCAWAERRES